MPSTSPHNSPVTTLKPFLSFAEQLQKLKNRGLAVGSDELALVALQRLNYYRLSGYWYPFRKTNPRGVPGRQDEFVPGTSFELILSLYEFDRHLRLLVMDAVERIEIAIRVDIAHRLGRKHPLAHETPSILDGKFTTVKSAKTGKTEYEDWSAKLAETIAKAKDEFVKHHVARYGGKMPVWVVVELLELRQLSVFFSGMQHSDQSYIAKRYSAAQGNHLAAWLRAITILRNISAHHGRLWNRNITSRPTFPPTQQHFHLHHVATNSHAQTRVYGVLSVIQQMLHVAAPDSSWGERLKSHCAAFPANPIVSLNDAGFPNDWDKLSLWNKKLA
jgi:abortive infection bacteriophage resistance protein